MIQLLISELVEYGIEHGFVESIDEVYVTNRLMELLKSNEYQKQERSEKIRPIHEILEDILRCVLDEYM